MVDVQRRTTARSPFPAVALVVIAVAAIAVRLLFVDEISADYRTFLSPWYDYLSANGGFAGVGGDFSNYNPPYLYLLAALTYLPIPKLLAIKLLSVAFDVLLASFAAKIVRLRFGNPAIWVGCFAAVLFAPTVLLNSSAWGQCDSIYAAFCLASLYFLLTKKPWWACIFFGLALSFKLQAIFFLPVLLIVLVVNRQRLLALAAIPAVFALMLVPAALAGRDLSSLLMVYPDQVSTGGGFGVRAGGNAARAADSLGLYTQNAPTFYQWVGSATAWKYLGLTAAALFVAVVGAVTWLRRRPLTSAEIVVLATTVVLTVPFLLPQMHERYFYLADVLTIVTAFYVRRYWPVALVVSACSLLSYAPFLWNTTIVPLPLVAFAEFLAVLATVAVLIAVLRGGTRVLREPAVSGPGALPAPA